eukprot:TRINITY_DN3701_c0_g1_i2.p1 TRINITY_DN3701_c0_g1~~TRINITY_DN3701_c0_g1_i2.p1  ORF type:complete len:197 (-),score=46.73 TRINITY_DN3701_c0_g1_i2:175-765(-)
MEKDETQKTIPKPRPSLSSWDLFQPVRSGEDIPPPPTEIVNWAKATTIGVCIGSIASGLLAFRREDLIIQEELQGFKRDEHNRPILKRGEVRAFHNRKLSKFSNAGVRGGMYIGGFVGLYSGLEIVSWRLREEKDFLNSVAAGGATGFLFGIRNGIKVSLIGAATGAAVSLPIGLFQDYARSQGYLAEAIPMEVEV